MSTSNDEATNFDEWSALEQLSDDAVSYLFDASVDSRSSGICWGGSLQGNTSFCTPGFVPLAGHFKNKLCPRCKANGLFIPSERICALPASASHGVNKQGTGLWTNDSRMVNHTAKCTGPPLLIFRDPQPTAERASWAPMPSGWLAPDGRSMKLVVALGTLRPASALNPSNRSRAASSGPASSCTVDAGPFSAGGAQPEVAESVEEELSWKRPRLEYARATGTADTSAADVADTGAATAGTSIISADVAAISAAFTDPSFQAMHEKQLRAFAAAFPSLDSSARSAMHQMYTASSVGALCAACGEEAVHRMLEANGQTGAAHWSAFSPTHVDETARLAVWLTCLQNEDVWAAVVESHSLSNTAADVAPGSLPPPPLPSSQLDRLADGFARVALSGASDSLGDAPAHDNTWREYVESMLALIPRESVPSGTHSTSGAAGGALLGGGSVMEAEDVRFDFVMNEHHSVAFTLADLDAAERGAPLEPQTADSVAAHASVILHRLLRELGWRSVTHFSPAETLMQFDGPLLKGDAKASSALVCIEHLRHFAFDLAVRLLGNSAFTYRMLEQRLEDGCRLTLVNWDAEAGKPLHMDEKSQLANLVVMTLTYNSGVVTGSAAGGISHSGACKSGTSNSGVAAKPWRLSVAKANFLPDSVLRWPNTALARMMGMQSLIKLIGTYALEQLNRAIAACSWPDAFLSSPQRRP